MGFDADAAGSVSNEVNLVTVAERLDDRHGEAYLGPQRGHNDFLPARLLNPLRNAAILPRINERTVNRFLVGKNILERFKDVAALAFEHGRKERWHAKSLRNLGQPNSII